jgi:signal transduction histidine kinase
VSASRTSELSVTFPGDGEMATRCRALDWAATPLGPVEAWSSSLRATAALVLMSRQPMFLWWGLDLVQIYNDAYRPSFGEHGRHPAALGMRGRECWTDIWDAIGPQIEQVLSGGPSTWHEDQYLPIERNGGLDDVWWTYSYSAVRDDDGTIAGVLVVCQETTARVLSEKAHEQLTRELDIERSRLEYVFKRAPSFLAVLRGPDKVFTHVNDAYYQLVGHRDILGKPVWEALPEVRGQGFEELLDQVIQTGEPFVGRAVPVTVARTLGAPPEARFIDLSYLPLVEADGTRAGIIAHGTDVTEPELARREVERLLAESERARVEADHARSEADVARQAAEEANRVKADFLATMSHELRTPLNAIGGYAEILEMGIRGPVTPEQASDLHRIQASQRHLLGLVNDVLDLAKVDSGHSRVEHTAVRAGDTVDAALALVRPQAAAKEIVIGEICDSSGEHPYLGDEPRVRQVLVNLLANAVKFTPVGGHVAITCAISAAPPADSILAPEGPYVAITVEDSGRGIPHAERERIFEPFTQLAQGDNPYAKTSGGTGLGLAISRRLARLMGGDVTVESEPDRGSAFTLWLPTQERRSSQREMSAHDAGERRRGGNTGTDVGAGVARIGRILAADSNLPLRSWAARVREDEVIPAHGRSNDEIEDHVATFITDLGLALRTLGESPAGGTDSLRDSRAILAVVCERHGAQRARLVWTEAAVRREFELLLEVLREMIQKIAGPSHLAAGERAQEALAQLLVQAERLSVASFRIASPVTDG